MNYNRHSAGLNKVRRVLRAWRGDTVFASRGFYDDNSELAKRMLKARVRCSGPCCGNPRRHFGKLTIQEHKANDAFDAALVDLNKNSDRQALRSR